jgi:hypothetical protein
LPEIQILITINSRESGFARMLQSDVVIWFQRYQRSDLKRGSISLARQIVIKVLVRSTFLWHIERSVMRLQ